MCRVNAFRTQHYRLTNRSAPSTLSEGQKGSVMLIGIIFLFAMAVISLSSLSGVVTQERRASNSNAKSQAENAALSAINAFLRDVQAENPAMLRRVTTAVAAGSNAQPLGPFRINGSVPSPTHTADLYIRMIDMGNNPQSSQDADQSNGVIDAVFLEVISEGYNTNNDDVRVEIRRGFRFQ